MPDFERGIQATSVVEKEEVRWRCSNHRLFPKMLSTKKRGSGSAFGTSFWWIWDSSAQKKWCRFFIV